MIGDGVAHETKDPRKDPDLVVVKIGGRYLAFRRAHGSKAPKRPASPPPLPTTTNPPPLPTTTSPDEEVPSTGEVAESDANDTSVEGTVVTTDAAPPRAGFGGRVRSMEQGLRVWILSAVVHCLVALFSGFVAVSVIATDEQPMLVTSTEFPEDGSELQSFQVESEISDFSEPAAAQSVTSPVRLPDPSTDFRPISPISSEHKIAVGGPALPPGPVGIANGDVLGRGTQMFMEVPAKRESTGANFFGVEAPGDNFVFVVDSSKSMRGKRWRLATRELLAAIQRLTPEQSFYVIFFDSVPHPMFGKQLAQTTMSATSQNLLRLRRWMRNVEFGDATSPQSSIEMAMALNADAVFLLTDGEFRDKTREVLLDDNRKLLDNGKTTFRSVVHTIGFQSRASQVLLMKIAEENGGRYRFIK